MTKVTPFLMFDDQLEAAMAFYTATFPDSELADDAQLRERLARAAAARARDFSLERLVAGASAIKTRLIEREFQDARLQAVKTNRPLRVRTKGTEDG